MSKGEIAYGRTPFGQLIYDLGFTRLSDSYLARKHRLPVAKIWTMRASAKRGLREGAKLARRRKAKR